MKCGGNFSKGKLAVCPAKDTTCTSCKFKGPFTRLCKSRRKSVNIVNTQIVDLRDPYLKIYAVDKETKDLYCGFTDNAKNISGEVLLPIFSNG